MGRRDLIWPGQSWSTSSSQGAHAFHHSGCAAAQPGPDTEWRRGPRPVLSITGTEWGRLSRRGPVPAPLPGGAQAVSTELL